MKKLLAKLLYKTADKLNSKPTTDFKAPKEVWIIFFAQENKPHYAYETKKEFEESKFKGIAIGSALYKLKL